MSDVAIDTLNTQFSLPVAWQLSFSLRRDQPPMVVDIDAVRYRVGRRDSANLVLNAPQLSGVHAEFGVVGIRLFVRDLASTNGTYVNGKRIGYHDVPLRDGDHIRMANVEFTVLRRQVNHRPATVPPAAPEPLPESQFEDTALLDLTSIFGGDPQTSLFPSLHDRPNGSAAHARRSY